MSDEAAAAWSARALDWAYLMEPLFLPVYDALAAALGMGPADRVLDVACGAGLGMRRYAATGAEVAGADIATGLLAVTAARLPKADIRVAPMTELPWTDGSFTAVTGTNAFAYADDGALAEAHRVLRTGGRLALGFWTDPADFGPAMAGLADALAPYVGDENSRTPLRMADPDTARTLLAEAGFSIETAGQVSGTSEFPDIETAYRGLASTGMIYPVVQAGAEQPLRERTLTILASQADDAVGVRLTAQFGWVVARKV